MKVLWVHRKQRVSGNFSIENSFSSIRGLVEKYVQLKEWYSPSFSNGVVARISSVLKLRKEKADVFHITGDVHFLSWGVPAKRNLLTIHDCGFLHRKNLIIRQILKYYWLTGPVKRASLVSCVSDSTRQDILKHTKCDPDKVRVVPTVIDPRWKKFPKPFNTEKTVLLQIGTKENKNLDRLAEAISDLNVVLWIVGELTPQQSRLLQRFNVEYENFFNLSFESLEELYHKCDIVTFCSTFEGFGMPIIEGNIVGRVVLSSNCSSMPEVARDAAHLVDPFSVDSIRQGLVDLVENEALRVRYLEAGYKNALRYKAEEVAEQYLQLYKEIAKK